jgi:hypothetical protein
VISSCCYSIYDSKIIHIYIYFNVMANKTSKLLQAIIYFSVILPSFHLNRCCLLWTDEFPQQVSFWTTHTSCEQQFTRRNSEKWVASGGQWNSNPWHFPSQWRPHSLCARGAPFLLDLLRATSNITASACYQLRRNGGRLAAGHPLHHLLYPMKCDQSMVFILLSLFGWKHVIFLRFL